MLTDTGTVAPELRCSWPYDLCDTDMCNEVCQAGVRQESEGGLCKTDFGKARVDELSTHTAGVYNRFGILHQCL